MIKILLKIVLMAAALYGAVVYLDGISIIESGYGFRIALGTVFFSFLIIELAVHPLLNLVILPLRVITFNIASVALSVALVFVVSVLPMFEVTSVVSAIVLGVAFGVIRSLTK